MSFVEILIWTFVILAVGGQIIWYGLLIITAFIPSTWKDERNYSGMKVDHTLRGYEDEDER